MTIQPCKDKQVKIKPFEIITFFSSVIWARDDDSIITHDKSYPITFQTYNYLCILNKLKYWKTLRSEAVPNQKRCYMRKNGTFNNVKLKKVCKFQSRLVQNVFTYVKGCTRIQLRISINITQYYTLIALCSNENQFHLHFVARIILSLNLFQRNYYKCFVMWQCRILWKCIIGPNIFNCTCSSASA